MFKKLGMMLLAGLMVVSLAACGSKDSFKAGTFTGEADGFGGKVTVELTLDDTKTITNVNVISTETEAIGEVALDKLSEKVLTLNSIEVDAVAGATMSSTAFLEAATAALEAAGLTAADLVKNAVEGYYSETKEADVVVIGAGGAGMTAAITAAQAGKSVIIVEEAAITGGNTTRATGGMNAAKTDLQDENKFDEAAGVEKGIAAAAAYENLADLQATVAQQWADYQANPEGYFDSVELFILDTMVGGKGINNIDLVTTLANNSADAIDWLASLNTPISLTSVSSFGGASVKRIHRPLNAEGKTVSVGSYMVPLLEENCKSLGVEIITEANATSLTTNDAGEVAGVIAVSGETTYTINAKSVVLATGGFGANLEMVVEYKPELAGFATTNASTILGDGIRMATEAGAATVDMDQIQIHPTVYVSESGSTSLITEGLRGDGAILVNQEGVRFCDEVGTRDAVSAAELAQTGSYAYLIVDQAMVDASSVIAGYITKGLTMNAEGQTAAELAATLECDPETLENTITTWNSYVEAKEDPEFGRTSFANPLLDSYYAIKITPAVHHTMGGVVINSNAEVLNAEGTAIANLYAAGEVTGGVHGANRLGGNAVADIVVFGRIAGASAAANAE